jgi:hypothetical protein
VGASGSNETTVFQNECDRNAIGETLTASEEKTLTFDYPIRWDVEYGCDEERSVRHVSDSCDGT